MSGRMPNKRLDLTTERFHLRGLLPTDANEDVGAWFGEEAVAKPLNRAVAAMPVEALAREFATADGVRLFVVGIFPLPERNRLIGYYTLQRAPHHRTVTFNVVIGDQDWWGRGVVLETRAALLDHMFAERGVDKAIGMPHARNFPSVFNYKRQGWRQEGVLKGHSLGADGKTRLDQIQFGLMADEWAGSRKKGAT